MKITKKCALCGKEFITTNNYYKMCKNPHPWHCAFCGRPITVKRLKSNNIYICNDKKCINKLRAKTTREKYNVDNVSQAKEIRNKISQKKQQRTQEQLDNERQKRETTLLKHYGVKSPLQSKEIHQKTIKTNLIRYGVDNPAKNKDIIRKTKENNLKKYGVTSTAKLNSVIEKINKTKIKRYGTVDLIHKNNKISKKYHDTLYSHYKVDNPSKSNIIINRIKKTNQLKYGVNWTTQSPIVRNKMKNTLKINYGVDNPGKSNEIMQNAAKKRSETNKNKIINNLSLINKKEIINKLWMIYKGTKTKSEFYDFFTQYGINRDTIAKLFDCSKTTVSRKLTKLNLNKIINYQSSKKEYQLIQLLQSKYPNIHYIYNDRTVLDGKELDFYFPEQKFAVELSPTSTHNSKKVGFNGVPKSRLYHKNKFLECAKKNIELITVFDWLDWNKILEMIEYKLQVTERIYARKTKYVEYDKITPELFNKLNDWHILGLPSNFKRHNSVSTLIYNNNIVGIALWTTMHDNTKIELKRMVFKPKFSITGGASKLIKNFTQHHQYKNIITFSDDDLGTGKVYKTIGFNLIEESRPNLIYWNDKYKKEIKYTSLVMQGADRLMRKIPNYKPYGLDCKETNKEIVEKYGFLPVYDCGYRKWEMKIV